jgi:hypothetical protein
MFKLLYFIFILEDIWSILMFHTADIFLSFYSFLSPCRYSGEVIEFLTDAYLRSGKTSPEMFEHS